MTTRYQSDHPKAGWQALDIVTADLTYQDGRESYKNIKVGNKSVNTSMDEIPGTRSTGEFSTLLEQLFESGRGQVPARRAGYDSQPLGVSSTVSKSHANFRAGGSKRHRSCTIRPLKGSVWIDKETSRVLRIEQQGKAMPALFPFDTIETPADYDFIRLGTSGPYLLPVESEVLSCQRGHQHLLAQ